VSTEELIIFASIFFLIVILALLPMLIHRTIIATIAGFSWTRKVLLEQYLWVEESSYSGFPDESRNQQSNVEIYNSYQIVSYNTKTTQVNGITSTTTEPVYGDVPKRRTKYTYEIQEWVHSRTLVAEGNEHNSVHWPHYTLDHSTSERIEDTKETYHVFFQTAKGRQYQQNLAERDWNALNDTMEYALRVNLYGKITKPPEVRNTTAMYNHPQKM
jgi:hypothetical protein